ncbi:MAG: hypothetical protein FJ034_01730 [Chloroflexi bacterium]|nr:hypothetical protein [Chloroflexota bacterium]
MIALRTLAVATLLVLMAAPGLAADPVTARAALDKVFLTAGDPVLLTVEVRTAAGYRITDPGVTRTLGRFEVLETLNAQQTGLAAGALRTSFRYRITAFSVGETSLPAITIRFADPSGVEGSVTTEPIAMKVGSVIADGEDTTRIQPLRPPLEIPGGTPYAIARTVTVLAAAGLGASALIALVRSRRRAARRTAEPEPVAAGFALATADDLTRLARERLPDEGRFDEHYERLSRAIRTYLTGRYGIAAGQRTASELRSDLERAGVERSQTAFLHDLLREGEVVRFRRLPPSPRHANDVLQSALDYLRKAAVSEEYDLAGGRSRA